jgi:hypothetical protein
MMIFMRPTQPNNQLPKPAAKHEHEKRCHVLEPKERLWQKVFPKPIQGKYDLKD